MFLIEIAGPSGVGKSALARELANCGVTAAADAAREPRFPGAYTLSKLAPKRLRRLLLRSSRLNNVADFAEQNSAFYCALLTALHSKAKDAPPLTKHILLKQLGWILRDLESIHFAVRKDKTYFIDEWLVSRLGYVSDEDCRLFSSLVTMLPTYARPGVFVFCRCSASLIAQRLRTRQKKAINHVVSLPDLHDIERSNKIVESRFEAVKSACPNSLFIDLDMSESLDKNVASVMQVVRPLTGGKREKISVFKKKCKNED